MLDDRLSRLLVAHSNGEWTRCSTRSDLPKALAEHPLPGDRESRAWVDRAWPDGDAHPRDRWADWHAREQAMAKDRARDRAAARAGWLTIRVLDDEVTSCPDAVLDDVTTAFAVRLAQLRRSG